HFANLLIVVGPGDQPRLYLIDLHAVRLQKGALSWRTSRGNLVLLNRWGVLRFSRTDRLRFWRAYSAARKHGPAVSPPGSAREVLRVRDIEQRTWASNDRFWSRRDRRSLRTNRYFLKLQGPTVTGHCVRDLDRAAWEELLTDPDALFRQPGIKLL